MVDKRRVVHIDQRLLLLVKEAARRDDRSITNWSERALRAALPADLAEREREGTGGT